jgi:hypothetical protein
MSSSNHEWSAAFVSLLRGQLNGDLGAVAGLTCLDNWITVLHEINLLITMNVTLELPDHLAREARHLASDEQTSLSALVCELLDARLKERKQPHQKAPNLAESLLLPDEPEWFAQTGFPLLTRDVVPLRATPFRFERDPEE